jgi:hypothetical protein
MTMDVPKYSMFAALKEHWPEYLMEVTSDE